VPVDLLTFFELDKALKELETLKNISFAVYCQVNEITMLISKFLGLWLFISSDLSWSLLLWCKL